MNLFRKLLFLVILILCLGKTAEAQENKKVIIPSIGFVINHEDLGSEFKDFDFGIHLGFNVYSTSVKRFKSDFQFSVNFSNEAKSASSIFTANVLYGVRYYFTDPEKPTSFFMNGLIGGALINETGDDFTETLLDVGYSAGFYLDTKQFVFGVCAESFNNFILKVAYEF